jgi:hypothetical protein
MLMTHDFDPSARMRSTRIELPIWCMCGNADHSRPGLVSLPAAGVMLKSPMAVADTPTAPAGMSKV